MTTTAAPHWDKHPYRDSRVLMVDWRACLDSPGPTDAMRALGHKVYVTGPGDGWGDAAMHVLGQTGFGIPAPWEEIMVSLGTGGRAGLLYAAHDGRPFISNGQIGFHVDRDVADAVASCETSKEISRDDYVAHIASLASADWGSPVDLHATTAIAPDTATVVRIGPAFVDARFVFAAVYAGARYASPSTAFGAVSLREHGVMMPMRLDEKHYT